MAVHAVEAALVQPQNRRLVLAEGLLGDGNRDKRITVAVAADPAAKA